MKIEKKSDNFILYLSLSLFFVLTLFLLSVNLDLCYVYGVDEKAIYFGRSIDISSNNGTSGLPQISSQGNNVYVVWQDNTNGNNDIYFTYSSDKGGKFEPVRNLSNNSGTSGLPQISSQGNNVYVVWQDNTNGNYDIFFKPSLATGTKFKAVRNLSNNSGTSQLPQITSQGTNVYVAWQDNTTGNYDIFFKRSPNGGTGFRSVNIMNKEGNSIYPKLTAQGSNIYVVWQNNSTGNYDVYFQPFNSNGTKFKSVRNLSNNNGTSQLPQVAASANDVYVIWKDDETGTSRIFFKHGQIDNSTGTLKMGNLNKLYHIGDASQAKLAWGSEFFYGVWTTHINKNNASIIGFYPFMLFEDYSGDAMPLSSLSSKEILANPSITTDGSDTYLVWENESVGNGDIFFKKLSTSYFNRSD